MAEQDQSLREHLIKLLQAKGAHVGFSKVFNDFPAELRGKIPPDGPYSGWQLLEHMRISQWDILEFSRDANHVSPEWPKAYWPESPEPPDDRAWEKSVAAFMSDLEEMQELVRNPETDLYAKIPHGTGQTVLREALLVADHNAYHLGEMVLLRKLLGAWS